MLTNGRTFNFYTDLAEPNKLDTIPFLTFDLSEMQGQVLAELRKFAKDEFNIDGIRSLGEPAEIHVGSSSRRLGRRSRTLRKRSCASWRRAFLRAGSRPP